MNLEFSFSLGMSCPSWQWHKTGYRWSPVRTIPVAPLWCDLGRCSRTVVVIKLRRTSAYNVRYQDGLGWSWHVAACRRACVTNRTSPARSVNLTATPVLGGMTGRCIRASLGSARNGRLRPMLIGVRIESIQFDPIIRSNLV